MNEGPLIAAMSTIMGPPRYKASEYHTRGVRTIFLVLGLVSSSVWC